MHAAWDPVQGEAVQGKVEEETDGRAAEERGRRFLGQQNSWLTSKRDTASARNLRPGDEGKLVHYTLT